MSDPANGSAFQSTDASAKVLNWLLLPLDLTDLQANGYAAAIPPGVLLYTDASVASVFTGLSGVIGAAGGLVLANGSGGANSGPKVVMDLAALAALTGLDVGWQTITVFDSETCTSKTMVVLGTAPA